MMTGEERATLASLQVPHASVAINGEEMNDFSVFTFRESPYSDFASYGIVLFAFKCQFARQRSLSPCGIQNLGLLNL